VLVFINVPDPWHFGTDTYHGLTYGTCGTVTIFYGSAQVPTPYQNHKKQFFPKFLFKKSCLFYVIEAALLPRNLSSHLLFPFYYGSGSAKRNRNLITIPVPLRVKNKVPTVLVPVL
jgi:hypothetical protein